MLLPCRDPREVAGIDRGGEHHQGRGARMSDADATTDRLIPIEMPRLSSGDDDEGDVCPPQSLSWSPSVLSINAYLTRAWFCASQELGKDNFAKVFNRADFH